MLYIGTDDGIYRWFPGANWPIFHSLQGRAVVHLASPGGGIMVATDQVGRVWETLDNGQDWREVARPAGTGRPTALAIARAPALLVLATRPSGLQRRVVGQVIQDSGPSPWRLAEGQAARWVDRAFSRALGRRAEPTATAVADRPEAPSRSPNPEGWVPLPTPGEGLIRALVPGLNTWFAAVAGAGLWRSTDGGASWAQCPGLPAEVYAIRPAPKPAGMVAVATSDGCWISADDGQSWADRSGGLEGARHVRAVEFKPGNANVLLAGTAPTGPGEGPAASRGGLRFALYESKDGGKSWSHVKRGFPEVLEFDTISDIRFDPADPDYAVVALASGELWNTRSDGLWWEPLARQIQTARVLCATG